MIQHSITTKIYYICIMSRKMHITSRITVIALLSLGIAASCIMHLSNVGKENKAYSTATPLLYIAAPHNASIITTANTIRPLINTHICKEPLLNALTATQHRTARDYCVASYHNKTWASWCAIHPKEESAIIKRFIEIYSNGHTPVTEQLSTGKILHIATEENRFLHIFTQPGIIGCSTEISLLTQHANDSTLLHAAQKSLKEGAHEVILRHDNNSWHTYQAVPNTP